MKGTSGIGTLGQGGLDGSSFNLGLTLSPRVHRLRNLLTYRGRADRLADATLTPEKSCRVAGGIEGNNSERVADRRALQTMGAIRRARDNDLTSSGFLLVMTVVSVNRRSCLDRGCRAITNCRS